MAIVQELITSVIDEYHNIYIIVYKAMAQVSVNTETDH